MKRVGKRVWFFALFFTFLLLGFVVVTWSSMQAHYELACSTVWAIVTTYSGGQSTTTSTPYEQCEWITTYSDDGGGGGGGGGTPPGEQEPPPGGGGSTTPVINYDTNSTGFVDCYQTAIFHTTALSITTACDVPRSNAASGTHDALDLWIQNIDGKAAYSVCNGTVQKVSAQRDANGALTGWGYYVEIKDSEGNLWRYAHLKGTDLDPSGVGLTKDGQVTAGTSKVGLCDSSGCEATDGGTANAHLHLEYWKNGVKTCPVDKLGNCASKA